jgi:hypothetical protein
LLSESLVLAHQGLRHPRGVGRLVYVQPFLQAGQHASVVLNVVAYRLRGVLSLPRCFFDRSALHDDLPTDDSFVRDRRSHVVEGSAARDYLPRLSLVLLDAGVHRGRADPEDRRHIAGAQESSLAHGVPEQADYHPFAYLRWTDSGADGL